MDLTESILLSNQHNTNQNLKDSAHSTPTRFLFLTTDRVSKKVLSSLKLGLEQIVFKSKTHCVCTIYSISNQLIDWSNHDIGIYNVPICLSKCMNKSKQCVGLTCIISSCLVCIPAASISLNKNSNSLFRYFFV